MQNLPIIFADGPPWPASAELAGWLACLGGLLWILNQGMELRASTRDKPSAGEVQEKAHEVFAKKVELDRHIADDDAKMAALRSQVQKVDNDLEEFRGDVQSNGETRRKSIEGKLEASHTQLFALITKQSESLQTLAVNQSAMNATLAAWKDAPPWKIRRDQ